MVETSNNGQANTLIAEVRRAEELVKAGDFEGLNSELFPLLAKTGRLQILQLRAINALVREAHDGRVAVRQSPESVAAIGTYMSGLIEIAIKIASSIQINATTGPEVAGGYWLDQDSKLSIEAAIALGVPEAIDAHHIPVLAAFPVQTLRWRIIAAGNAIIQLKGISEKSFSPTKTPQGEQGEDDIKSEIEFYKDKINIWKQQIGIERGKAKKK